eukprot:m.341655 g.341655  ORF g.341655 m.341655 type:complete len:300 (-) comp16114_c0_seq5:2303-3202(-)
MLKDSCPFKVSFNQQSSGDRVGTFIGCIQQHSDSCLSQAPPDPMTLRVATCHNSALLLRLLRVCNPRLHSATALQDYCAGFFNLRVGKTSSCKLLKQLKCRPAGDSPFQLIRPLLDKLKLYDQHALLDVEFTNEVPSVVGVSGSMSRFSRLFCAPGVHKNITALCYPIVAIDGTHLTHPSLLDGKLLIASTLNGAKKVTLLAYTIAHNETQRNYEYFLRHLAAHQPHLCTSPFVLFTGTTSTIQLAYSRIHTHNLFPSSCTQLNWSTGRAPDLNCLVIKLARSCGICRWNNRNGYGQSA